MWKVEFTKRVRKDAKKLQSSHRERIVAAMDKLALNPYDSKKMEGTADFHSIRVGEFRIVFEIRKKESLILVHRIAKRENVYLAI
ncbi:MAG: type II toxin-antitoxin system RelE/ParE family toxin [Candidatus Micrarchaeota archaeon]